jgi:hypothetical protein
MLKNITEDELDLMHENAKRMAKGNVLGYYILINIQLKSLALIGIKNVLSEKMKKIKERILEMF